MWPIVVGGAVVLLKLIFDSDTKSDEPRRRIFISHSWAKSTGEYKKLLEKLEKEGIKVFNHSIPEHKAFEVRGRERLKIVFRKQMIYCSKIYVLAYRGLKEDSFIGDEIRIAHELGKEIIVVKPHGQSGIPQWIRRKADKVISNHRGSLVDSLKSAENG